jgi:hypothetical protein
MVDRQIEVAGATWDYSAARMLVTKPLWLSPLLAVRSGCVGTPSGFDAIDDTRTPPINFWYRL